MTETQGYGAPVAGPLPCDGPGCEKTIGKIWDNNRLVLKNGKPFNFCGLPCIIRWALMHVDWTGKRLAHGL